MSDLRYMIGADFSNDIEVFDNHSVVHGQDTNEWVARALNVTHRSVKDLLIDYDRIPSSLLHYFIHLDNFLNNHKSSHLQRRQHSEGWISKVAGPAISSISVMKTARHRKGIGSSLPLIAGLASACRWAKNLQ